MKINILKKIIFVTLSTSTAVVYSFAAQVLLEAPNVTLTQRQPVVVTLKLDNEGKSISGVSGNFSFPSDLFTVDSFILESSIVSPWIVQPKVSEEKYLDNRTHITFEGIFPGGYSGVKSPYYSGVEPGALFSVILIPKQQGSGLLIVDDITLLEYGPNAYSIPTDTVSRTITVPEAQGKAISPYPDVRQIVSKTLTTNIVKDPLVRSGAWYVVINDSEPVATIEKIYVAETSNGDILNVNPSSWRKVDASYYVLLYQNRSKYIHIKVMYSNKTYVLRTIPPVENSQSISFASRILVSIVVLSVLIYLYDKKIYYYFRKKM